ncbi:hypothetical protein PG994_013327 [Apiospora phragmitis]|uniref:Uncharacterized protein n=1 Tax=Apiospora phragmitis TaxID=2905665 RepID=A0ABR1TAJ9_9PEZI
MGQAPLASAAAAALDPAAFGAAVAAALDSGAFGAAVAAAIDPGVLGAEIGKAVADALAPVAARLDDEQRVRHADDFAVIEGLLQELEEVAGAAMRQRNVSGRHDRNAADV